MGYLYVAYSSALWLCGRTARQISQKCSVWATAQVHRQTCRAFGWRVIAVFLCFFCQVMQEQAGQLKLGRFLTNASQGDELWEWEQAVYVQTPGPLLKDMSSVRSEIRSGNMGIKEKQKQSKFLKAHIEGNVQTHMLYISLVSLSAASARGLRCRTLIHVSITSIWQTSFPTAT